METTEHTVWEADPSGRARPFGKSLPMTLLRGREAIMRRLRPTLRDHGVTDQQWRILRALAEDGQVEMLELSQRCIIQPPSLSRTVPALAERGLVRRDDHPTDRRRAVISLTEAGHALFGEISARTANFYEHLVADVGEEAIAELYHGLQVVIERLEAAENGDVTVDDGGEDA